MVQALASAEAFDTLTDLAQDRYVALRSTQVAQFEMLLAMPHDELAAFTLWLLAEHSRRIEAAGAEAVSAHQRHAAKHRRPRRGLVKVIAKFLADYPEASSGEVLEHLRDLAENSISLVLAVDDDAGVIDWECTRKRRQYLTPISALPTIVCRVKKRLRVKASSARAGTVGT